MHILEAAVVLAVFTALPRASATGSLTPRPLETTAAPAIEGQMPNVLYRLGIRFISRAHAAECTPEGETCTSKECLNKGLAHGTRGTEIPQSATEQVGPRRIGGLGLCVCGVAETRHATPLGSAIDAGVR
jgi:hypothetical protein